MIKSEYRDLVEPGSPFGAEVLPPPGADDWERLAAFMGRDPRAPLGAAVIGTNTVAPPRT